MIKTQHSSKYIDFQKLGFGFWLLLSWPFYPEGRIITSSVCDRIKRCRQAISVWSKEFYVNSKKKITELKEALDTALSALISDDDMISTLNQQLMTAYRAEEEY